MAVSGNHNLESRSLRLQIQRSEIVKHIYGDTGEFHHLSLRKLQRPRPLVNISAHGCNWRDLPKLLQNLRLAHIPRMNDVLRPPQRGHSFRSQQAVRIRDNADQNKSLLRRVRQTPFVAPSADHVLL